VFAVFLYECAGLLLTFERSILDNMPVVVFHPNQTFEYTEGVQLGFIGDGVRVSFFVFEHSLILLGSLGVWR
jgi:hypothetical protein